MVVPKGGDLFLGTPPFSQGRWGGVVTLGIGFGTEGRKDYFGIDHLGVTRVIVKQALQVVHPAVLGSGLGCAPPGLGSAALDFSGG